MEKLKLNNVSLVIADCLNIERAIKAVDICNYYCEFDNVTIFSDIEHKSDYDIIKIKHIKSKYDYSEFMIYELYKYIKTDFLLVIQWDGYILNPYRWDNDFLNYDYIGSPIKTHKGHYWCDYEGCVVGNGGFSLRSTELHKFIATDKRFVYNKIPEDKAICWTNKDLIEGAGFKKAPVELANKFSKNHKKYQGEEFGFHGEKSDISGWKDHKIFY